VVESDVVEERNDISDSLATRGDKQNEMSRCGKHYNTTICAFSNIGTF